MFKTCVLVAAIVSVSGLIAGPARADEWNKKTRITFSQPVEVAGHVLAAGTYTFQLADSPTDRHIVQIFSADGRTIVATVLAIPDYRLTATDETVIQVREVPAGSPQAIRAWFYPGNRAGQEFVYPKTRALELAKASNTVVPALAGEVAGVAALKTVPIVAITPDAMELPVAAAIQTTPPVDAGGAARGAEQLPKTASPLPLLALLGLGSMLIAGGALWLARRAPVRVM